jgi:hypothetical protein
LDAFTNIAEQPKSYQSSDELLRQSSTLQRIHSLIDDDTVNQYVRDAAQQCYDRLTWKP